MPSVLIANRGEIALRIIRTARKLGIRTIAVYSEADASAPHVSAADTAAYLGPSIPAQSYLNQEAILAAAQASGADAIHPGYGFLAENAEFACRVEAAGMIFIGPTPEQIEQFGTKHTSRELALKAGVPLMQGTGLLETEEQALEQAQHIGYPVMLKATGGGGGIGMQACFSEGELKEAFSKVKYLAESNFSTPGVFLEHLIRPARHVEVQLFGDGTGNIAIIGDRDCSLQRRNQKVVEEAPAPNLPDKVREELHASARRLGELVSYRSAGTVEFIYDPRTELLSFLEVNARLQVEHPVTEEVYGLDLVEQMLLLAFEGPQSVAPIMQKNFVPHGVACEARIYAEDPNNAGRPSPGLVTEVIFPEGKNVRVDAWIETGLEVSPYYDPMIAKIIVHASTREAALDLLKQSLAKTYIAGVMTNIGLLTQLPDLPAFHSAEHSTLTLDYVTDSSPRIDVLQGGMLTTVQDLPGRLGYWNIGIPPSGPMDEYSFRLANRAVGNPSEIPALECTLLGPTLHFNHAMTIALTGAKTAATLEGIPVPFWEPIQVEAGQTLEVGTIEDTGLRTYISFRGGLNIPDYLGSTATFSLGKFGGHSGRALAMGDVLRPKPSNQQSIILSEPEKIPEELLPDFTHDWYLGMLEGPQAAPEYLTESDVEVFYSAAYTVHFNVDRTGVRLKGPRPQWSREDGGEAGLHPSNVHDNPYVVGAVDFSGDTPILLGLDGPSLGGFICPAVLAPQQMWKMGQLKPGDTVHFIRISEAAVRAPGVLTEISTPAEMQKLSADGDNGILRFIPGNDEIPQIAYRRAGLGNILVEYGEPILDLGFRMRVYALERELNDSDLPGILEKTPGIRSLLIGFDSEKWTTEKLLDYLGELESRIGSTDSIVVPSRKITLPLSWDDDSVKQAVERYISTVRKEAPWLPWNVEFIRRINGLDSIQEVFDTVFAAEYMVMGLGDVYLGAPVATPLDPRHRLVTTKYNPARTFTAENAVGIGGTYLCIYGLEGPGGYQLIGRTVPIYSRYQHSGLFTDNPWALRFFDRISWYPVSVEELSELRREVAAGRGNILIKEEEFSYADYRQFLAENAVAIKEFEEKQAISFAAEKDIWRQSGEFDNKPESTEAQLSTIIAPGDIPINSPIMGGLWRIDIEPGQRVEKDQVLCILEAMKMETPVKSPVAGVISAIPVSIGNSVSAGEILAVVTPD